MKLVNVLLLASCLISAQAVPDLRIGEGGNVTIPCENEGRVMWSKLANRTRDVIFHSPPEEPPAQSKSHPRYSLLIGLTLVIQNVSASDSGFYFCNGTPVVDLNVVPLKEIRRDDVRGSATTLAGGGLYGDRRVLFITLAALFLSSLQ